MTPLTGEEKIFAEKHHLLIYSYLNKRKLDESEYYGIIAIGYIKAVKKYCTEKRLQQYEFSTIAFRSMKREMHNFFMYKRRIKRSYKEIRIEMIYNEETGSKNKNLYIENTFERTILNVSMEKLLTTQQLHLVAQLLLGVHQSELTIDPTDSIYEVITAIQFRLAPLFLPNQIQKFLMKEAFDETV